MPDLLTELRTLDPVAVPPTVQRESLDQLRDAVLASPRKVSRRWTAPLAAAAAVAIAFAFFWQSGLGQGKVRVVPAASPSPSVSPPLNAWAVTSPPPLSPRYSSVTVWAEGTFFVIGGTSSGVCPAVADCLAPTYLRDGAGYDPRTDSWTSIATAPEDVIGDPWRIPRVAVLGDTIYVLGRTSMLGYNVHTDQWQHLPFPPGEPVVGFGVTGSSLVAVATASDDPVSITYATFPPDQGEWVQHKVGRGLRGDGAYAEVVGGQLVLTSLADSPQGSIWVIDTVDPATGEIGHPDPPKVDSLHLEAIELTTSQAGYAVWRGRQQAWFLNLLTSQWSSVDLPRTDGAFVDSSRAAKTYWPVTVSGMVAIRGHLYNPETRLWAATPAIPTGPDSPIVATGPDLVLSCFGYNPTTSTFGKDCYVLRPAEASLPTP